jgi:hypothetical protein
MIVIYTPAGQAEPQRWQFDPDKVLASRMEMIERRWAGGADPDSGPSSYERWLTALQQGETKARRVLLWHLLNMEHPTLRLENVEFFRKEVEVAYTKVEYGRMIDAVTNSRRPADQKERIIATLLDQQAQAPDGDDEGKATSPPDSTTGGQPSRKSSTSRSQKSGG